jgi:hypothetical protein
MILADLRCACGSAAVMRVAPGDSETAPLVALCLKCWPAFAIPVAAEQSEQPKRTKRTKRSRGK